MDAEPADERERLGSGSLVLWGLVTSFVGLLGGGLVQNLLFNLYTSSLEDRPDFLGNGLNYLAIGFMFLIPLVDAFLLALVFMLYFPIRFSTLAAQGKRFAARRNANGAAAFVSLGLFLLMGPGSVMLLLLTIVPIALIAGVAAEKILAMANAELDLRAKELAAQSAAMPTAEG